MSKNKLTVSAYCRVSTEKDDQINSLNSQIQYFTEYINQHEGWKIGQVYYDEGLSGTMLDKRTSFNNMISDGREHKYDLILTKEVSRFARNTVDALSITRELKRIGIGVIFTTDNIDTRDSDGELRLTIMAGMAQDESRRISQRVSWGQRRMMERGYVFGRYIFGFDLHDGKLTINEDESDIVKRIYNSYVYEDKGTFTIAKELESNGIRTTTLKKSWDGTRVSRILRNEKYCGDLIQRKTYTPDFLSHKMARNYNNVEQLYFKDHHEAIIDRKTWDLAQEKLKNKNAKWGCEIKSDSSSPNKHSNRYWCSGKIICSKCQGSYVSRAANNKNGTKMKSWRCNGGRNVKSSQRQKYEYTYCPNGNINDKTLRICVIEAFNFIFTNKDSIIEEMKQEIKSVIKKSSSILDTSKLTSQIDKLNNKKIQSVDLMLEGIISKEQLKEQQEYYDEEITKLNTQLVETQRQASLESSRISDLDKCIDSIKQFFTQIPDSDNDDFLKQITDHIKIVDAHRDVGEIEIYLSGVPFGIRQHYFNFGKCDSFKTTVTSMEIVE